MLISPSQKNCLLDTSKTFLIMSNVYFFENLTELFSAKYDSYQLIVLSEKPIGRNYQIEFGDLLCHMPFSG